jgi:hypothetical protein
MKKIEVDGVCSTHGVDEKYIQILLKELEEKVITIRGRPTLKY